LQFIPIFWALHSHLRKGHTKKRHLYAMQKVSFTYNPEAKRQSHLLKIVTPVTTMASGASQVHYDTCSRLSMQDLF
jgi:hypothetical protein